MNMFFHLLHININYFQRNNFLKIVLGLKKSFLGFTYYYRLFQTFFQLLQSCNEEILFMWSNKSDTKLQSFDIPEGYGLQVDPSSNLMLMVVFEGFSQPYYDYSGLRLSYERKNEKSQRQIVKR